jgi:hypothetical protein
VRWQRIRRQQVAHDLANHFRDRVLVQVEDAIDTGRIARVSAGVTVGMIIRSLIYIAATMAFRTGTNKREFLAFCDGVFDVARKEAPELDGLPPARRARR